VKNLLNVLKESIRALEEKMNIVKEQKRLLFWNKLKLQFQVPIAC